VLLPRCLLVSCHVYVFYKETIKDSIFSNVVSTVKGNIKGYEKKHQRVLKETSEGVKGNITGVKENNRCIF
jgi:hypothetical protein